VASSGAVTGGKCSTEQKNPECWKEHTGNNKICYLEPNPTTADDNEKSKDECAALITGGVSKKCKVHKFCEDKTAEDGKCDKGMCKWVVASSGAVTGGKCSTEQKNTECWKEGTGGNKICYLEPNPTTADNNDKSKQECAALIQVGEKECKAIADTNKFCEDNTVEQGKCNKGMCKWVVADNDGTVTGGKCSTEQKNTECWKVGTGGNKICYLKPNPTRADDNERSKQECAALIQVGESKKCKAIADKNKFCEDKTVEGGKCDKGMCKWVVADNGGAVTGGKCSTEQNNTECWKEGTGDNKICYLEPNPTTADDNEKSKQECAALIQVGETKKCKGKSDSRDQTGSNGDAAPLNFAFSLILLSLTLI